MMGSLPKTGMERLLRLRDVQIAKARAAAQSSDQSRREAEHAAQHAQQAVEAFAHARHAAHSSQSLDVSRYSLLLESESIASEVRAARETEAEQRRREADEAAQALQNRLRQRQAVESRHERLSTELARALESKLDAQLADLWQTQQAKAP